jgi:hypothetical protein
MDSDPIPDPIKMLSNGVRENAAIGQIVKVLSETVQPSMDYNAIISDAITKLSHTERKALLVKLQVLTSEWQLLGYDFKALSLDTKAP